MHRDWAADHLLVTFAFPICPWLVNNHFPCKGRLSQISRKLANPRGGNADNSSHFLGHIAIIHVGFGHQHESRNGNTATLDLYLALQPNANICCLVRDRLSRCPVKNLWLTLLVAQEQPIICGTRVANDQPGRIRVAAQIININIAGAHQFADQRDDQKTISSRGYPVPIIRNRSVACLYRIDRHNTLATTLEFAKPNFDRV